MFNMKEIIWVCDKKYSICSFLGRGKTGYSYLVSNDNGQKYVLKQIHHEPCEYLTYDNKIEIEQSAYEILLDIGINVPKLYAIDSYNDRLIKEYIEGDTVYDLIKANVNVDIYIEQMKVIANLVKKSGYTLDYLSTNFVVNGEMLWYVDYECNLYEERWSFDNWGIKYWSQTPEYLENIEKYK